MDLIERIIFFAIGGGVGFILGYVVARLQTIESKVDAVKSEVHEVDVIVKHERDEEGSIRFPSITAMMLVLVVLITAYAAFSASRANEKLEDTVDCLTRFNTVQNRALTARDQAIQQSAQAEINLWGLYNELYKEGELPNTSSDRLEEIQDTLADAIRQYRLKLIDTQEARDDYDYGHPDVLKNCREQKEQG